ncbi:Phosphoglucomutase [Hibiscus syriacus]|uniref:Phosphoglucomutase n=1 Tax=Hibiscus syriacus TaxID=106335 RepID=A0A6A3AN49_HIBSY|nr:Phosphoglucomutase [Hibiscus syriacus]
MANLDPSASEITSQTSPSQSDFQISDFQNNRGKIASGVNIAQGSKWVIGSARLGKGLYTIEERKNRHLLEVTRSLMFAANAPKYLWREALITTTYLINRMPIETKGNDGYQEATTVDLDDFPIAIRKGINSVKIPRNVTEAFQSPEWKKVVEEEIKALQKNKTWSLTDLPEGKRAVGCKWIFTVKYHSDGSVERYKARLVAKVAVNMDWKLHHLDIKNAFLNGNLEEDVYIESPRAWFDRFAKAMTQNGFKQSQADHTLFIKITLSGKITLLIIYVDDMIITGSDIKEIEKLKINLAKEFETKDLGSMRYFLGMEIARFEEELIINQRKYVLDLLAETGMLDCKPVKTPMEPDLKFCKEMTRNPVNKETYQSLVGKLIYLSLTRPDIAYSVSIVSQHMSDPREEHLEVVNKILRTKHIEINIHFIYEKVNNGVAKLQYIPTKKQLPDIFTKALPGVTFDELSFKLETYSVFYKLLYLHYTSSGYTSSDLFPANGSAVGATLVVSGDGRYYSKDAIQMLIFKPDTFILEDLLTIIKADVIVFLKAANGVRRVWVGQNGLLSTPAVSAVLRERVGADVSNIAPIRWTISATGVSRFEGPEGKFDVEVFDSAIDYVKLMRFFVTPSDSVAIIAANAVDAIPYFSSGLKGVSRSMPTSTALDVVAKNLNLKFFEVLQRRRIMTAFVIIGELLIYYMLGSDHIREKDGIWAVLAWLSILAYKNKDNLNGTKLVTVENVDAGAANDLMAYLVKLQSSLDEINTIVKGARSDVSNVVNADEFEYKDPVDGSISKNQGIRFLFEDGSRTNRRLSGDSVIEIYLHVFTRYVFRLSGTGSEGATIRLYIEQYENDSSKTGRDSQGLAPLVEVSLKLSKMQEFIG